MRRIATTTKTSMMIGDGHDAQYEGLEEDGTTTEVNVPYEAQCYKYRQGLWNLFFRLQSAGGHNSRPFNQSMGLMRNENKVIRALRGNGHGGK